MTSQKPGFRRCATVAVAVLMLCVSPAGSRAQGTAAPDADLKTSDLKAWSGDRAMQDIVKQLSFGARSLGTPGHQAAIDWIKSELGATSVQVVVQSGLAEGERGSRYPMTNIIGRLNPQLQKRIIVGTHYDSIVRAYADPQDPNGPMPGANNSASGVALVLETVRWLAQNKSVGVDFVFFDGEEGPLSLGAGDPHWYSLGSPYFVTRLGELYPSRKPAKGVIFDMVCYSKLVLKPEPYSLKFAEPDVIKFWSIGNRIAPSIFRPIITSSPIFDDQTALNEAGIPSFLVIGFEYDPWFNTTKDTADKCAASSLEAVGRTLVQYLLSEAGQ
jgi:glutaminyl-peptide cyclotransferase